MPRYYTDDDRKLHRWFQISEASIIEDNKEKKNVLFFSDNSGFILDKENALELINQLKAFYDREDVEQLIAQNNKKSAYASLGITEENIYFNTWTQRMVYYFKPFRNDLKRDWSFKCAWCGKKVSSKEHKGYYLINSDTVLDGGLEDRSCSEDCVKLIWKEALNDYLSKMSSRK